MMVDEFRTLIAQTSHPNAWAETAQEFGIKRGDDPILEIMKKQAMGHSVNLEPGALNQLANEYDKLRQNTGITLPAETLDHRILVPWFLEKKGVFPKEPPAKVEKSPANPIREAVLNQIDDPETRSIMAIGVYPLMGLSPN